MSKKKKHVVQEAITDKAKEYYDLWVLLNHSSEEKIIDSIRKDMSALWSTMDSGDIRDFHRESDLYSRKHGNKF